MLACLHAWTTYPWSLFAFLQTPPLADTLNTEGAKIGAEIARCAQKGSNGLWGYFAAISCGLETDILHAGKFGVEVVILHTQK